MLLSHSLGTVIAYDCLKAMNACPPVAGFITLGSPLGLAEVQGAAPRRVQGSVRPYPNDTLPGERAWSNIFDRLDVVDAVHPKLAPRYQCGGVDVVQDAAVENRGAWRHDLVEYLRQPAVHGAILDYLGGAR